MGRSAKKVKFDISGLFLFLMLVGFMTPLLVLNDLVKSLRYPKRLKIILLATVLWATTIYCLFLKIKPEGVTGSQAVAIFAMFVSWRLLFMPAVNWSSQERSAAVEPLMANGNDFYKSRAWQDLRYQTLRKFGKKCMLCGTTKGSMHVDHIRPRSKHPEAALDPSNLQILCKNCNFGKSNIYVDDFRKQA